MIFRGAEPVVLPYSSLKSRETAPFQIYQGLDIITNKVTPAERDLVRHHLIDCASPLARWTVLDFRRRALPIVSPYSITSNILHVNVKGHN